MNSERAKKSGDADYYAKYDTQRGGKLVCIDLINSLKINFTFHIIARNLMSHFSKNECTLNNILAAEHYAVSDQLK